MSREGSDRQLHRYFDGDLPEEEREALGQGLAQGDEASRKLAALADLGTLVRATAAEPLGDSDSAAMWAAIEKSAGLTTSKGADLEIEAGQVQASGDAKSARPALRLIAGSGGVAATTKESAPAASAGVVVGLASGGPGNVGPASVRPAVEDLATRRAPPTRLVSSSRRLTVQSSESARIAISTISAGVSRESKVLAWPSLSF